MPKKQQTTYADINYAIEAIITILKEIQYEECENILNQAYSCRSRENSLDVDISESEEEEDTEGAEDPEDCLSSEEEPNFIYTDSEDSMEY